MQHPRQEDRHRKRQDEHGTEPHSPLVLDVKATVDVLVLLHGHKHTPSVDTPPT